MTPCRDCRKEVSEDAYMCPHCGAPRPSDPKWNGYGFEYRSPVSFLGLPLLHISFKYRNRRPVVARGWLAVGQFAVGPLTVSQFGVGVVCVSQFCLAGWALAQFTVAVRAVAQMAVVFDWGIGQRIVDAGEFLGL